MFILITFLIYFAFLLAYAVCGWLAICVLVRIANALLPPARRIPMRNWMMFGGPALLFVVILGWHAVVKPRDWRTLLYEQTFDACRDGDVVRVRVWLWLGASPDGWADYDGGEPCTEFASHVEAATARGNHRVLQLLLEKGADPNMGADDTTPLGTAINDHNAEAVRILLAHGADPRFGYGEGDDAAAHAMRMKFPDLAPLIQPYLSASTSPSEHR